MVFVAPSWVPSLSPDAIPDSIPISEFVLNEQYGRFKLHQSKSPFVCGLSGRHYTAVEVAQRVEYLARGLSCELGWQPNEGSEWDKVITIFALNTIDCLPLSWAIHRLSGISSPANAAYTASELTYQLKESNSKVLVTCWPLLDTALTAARNTGIPDSHVLILGMPPEVLAGVRTWNRFKTIDQLIAVGAELPSLPDLTWNKGQGARQCAFLNFSSGTTGLPKGVMVSHRNVIANILQLSTFEQPTRTPGQQNVVLGLLPQSHIYGLVAVCHASVYRGDSVVVLPKFELQSLLSAIQQFKIQVLFLVPPIVISMLRSSSVLGRFDLSSVTEVFSGAAHLDAPTCRMLLLQYPSWKIRQAYGLTETATVVSATSSQDIMLASAGSLLPGVKARLISLSDGTDITDVGIPGELLVQSPSVTNLGYLNNPKATAETFGAPGEEWLRTGDEAMFVRHESSGYLHLMIVDRIKELIKVKGHQVAPAELEACVRGHLLVADAAVIGVPDMASGEVPKAFIVLKGRDVERSTAELQQIRQGIQEHVMKEKARYKWLKGGVEFVDSILKSPSGKILRRVLRDAERQKRRTLSVKL